MRILLIILLLIPSLCFSQGFVNLNKSGVSIHRDSIGWAKSMARTYKAINSHMTVGRAAEDTIAARMAEDYVTDTYGPLGLDKKKADFFLYFETTQDSSFLTTRTVTNSSDSALMWDFGDTTYYQNNLPAHVAHHGAISATSYDDFDNITVFQLNSNSFTGGLFKLNAYMPALTDLRIHSNNFGPTITPLPSGMDVLYINNNVFTNLPDISTLSSLRYFHVYRNPDMTGRIPSVANPTTFREMQAFENSFTGVDATAFSEDLVYYRIQEQEMSAATLDSLIGNMVTFFTSNAPDLNATIELTGGLMGYVADTSSGDFQTLDDLWTAEGVDLTFTANQHPGAFSKGGIVFTFDDGLKNTLRITKPIFDEYDINGTCYHTIAHVDEPTSYGDSGMSWTETTELYNAGWTIGSHGCTHVNFSGLNATQLNEQVECILDSFAIHGFTDSLHFCYPFGGYTQESEDTIQDNFLSSRIVDDSYHVGLNSSSFSLPGVNFENTDGDFDYYKRYVDFAYENNVVVVFLSHGVYADCALEDHDNCLEISLLRAIIEYAQGLNLDILTIDELYNRIE